MEKLSRSELIAKAEALGLKGVNKGLVDIQTLERTRRTKWKKSLHWQKLITFQQRICSTFPDELCRT